MWEPSQVQGWQESCPIAFPRLNSPFSLFKKRLFLQQPGFSFPPRAGWVDFVQAEFGGRLISPSGGQKS